MRRREFIALMGASVAWPFAAIAQEVGRTYLVGQLSPFPRDAAFNITFYEELRRAFQQATKTIPIVAIAGDMFRSRLVTSLARQEGNTTGVSILSYEADGKRQDILIEAVPGL
jgi:putative tryptophan/tyrosine transport system substrate-binding protein